MKWVIYKYFWEKNKRGERGKNLKIKKGIKWKNSAKIEDQGKI